MKEEIIIAGFGGQGVLSMGKILAYSGLMAASYLLRIGEEILSSLMVPNNEVEQPTLQLL